MVYGVTYSRSIVVPVFGLSSSILGILNGNPKRNYNGDYRYGR